MFLPVQEVNALFRRFDVKGEGFADAEVGELSRAWLGRESRQGRWMVIDTGRCVDLMQSQKSPFLLPCHRTTPAVSSFSVTLPPQTWSR